MKLDELLEAIWLTAAFYETGHRGPYRESYKRAWLGRHLVERARYARVKLSRGRLKRVK